MCLVSVGVTEKYVPKSIKNIRDGGLITVHADPVSGQRVLVFMFM
jgi:hypothetical protein